MSKRAIIFLILAALMMTEAQAQKSKSQDNSSTQGMKGMDHANGDMAGMDMSSSSSDSSKPVNDAAMSSMSSKHMDMGPHMKMTALRPANTDDQKKADEIVEQLRGAIEKYKDFKVALADGFQIFHPEIPTPMKHFTNYSYAFEATYKFNPLHPTSLLYEKHGDDYTLVGAMYTAPKRFTEDDLNQRVPLSVAQWHEHVNFCMPPKDQERSMMSRNSRFGFAGTISTEKECDAAGGKFYPILFNWMVHVYPYEKKPEDIWAAERGQHPHGID